LFSEQNHLVILNYKISKKIDFLTTTKEIFMKSKSMILTALLSLTFFSSQLVLAGGAGLPPRYEHMDMIHCYSVNPNERIVRELTYLTTVQEGLPLEKGQSSLFLVGDLFKVLIDGGSDLPTITAPTDRPVAFHPVNGITAFMWNVRAIRILVAGNQLSLSMVAGALGQNKVTDLKMVCSAAN
jgi:hypothetical protein